MVNITEVVEEEQEEVPASQERLWDAEELEATAKSAKRVSVRMHLEAMAKKLRKESDALRRMESSNKAVEETTKTSSSSAESSPPPPQKQPKQEGAATTTTEPSAAAAAAPTPVATTKAVAPSTGKFTSIDRFSFDFGGYDSAFVTLYIPLSGVGSIPKANVTCDFTKDSFDLVVQDLENKSYRLFKDNLEKEIDPDKSKFVVKADKVVVKLAKKKGEYGSYDFWSKLTDPKGKKKKVDDKNPQASIMELMKDMYDSGDDNMKKVIGETMMKQQRGELDKGGMGGAGGLGDMKLDDDY